jgi:hypothetical protein
MRQIVFVTLAVLGLSACSPSAPKDANVSGEKAAASAAAVAASLEPGQWRTTITLTELDAAFMPQEAKAAIMAKPIVVEDCRTSTDVQEMTKAWSGSEDGISCGEEQFSVVGAQLKGSRACSNGPISMAMTFDGVYEAKRVDATTTMNITGPQGTMKQKAKVVAEHIGPCAAK